MTPRTWAEDKVAKAVTGYQWNGRIRKSTVTLPAIAAKLLQAEHARSVRVVKRFIRQYAADRDLIERTVAQNILSALQRGRTGRGK